MPLRTGMLFLFGVAVLLSGCQQNNDEESLPEETGNNRYIQVEDSDQTEQSDLSSHDIASHLAGVAGDIPNVHDATSVVAGPYAVVGIDVDKDLDRSRVGSIKYTVLEALQKDPYGKTAVVVADGDVVERIRSMHDKIRQGYPVQGVIDELSAIVGRYMPDFPINEDRPKERDQNKHSIPKDDKKQLDDIEEEQSNHQNDE
ncbi:YhcN/YlaJ family sporulation lipoprotein [Lentibacillus halophilus]|uniref:YhcN/YlaJ family sporulation lipoprotein n=1 Tax=Lentibacillus halophilus TaxID=295065 RepID=A0ABP3JCH5_9BACI